MALYKFAFDLIWFWTLQATDLLLCLHQLYVADGWTDICSRYISEQSTAGQKDNWTLQQIRKTTEPPGTNYSRSEWQMYRQDDYSAAVLCGRTSSCQTLQWRRLSHPLDQQAASRSSNRDNLQWVLYSVATPVQWPSGAGHPGDHNDHLHIHTQTTN